MEFIDSSLFPTYKKECARVQVPINIILLSEYLVLWSVKNIPIDSIKRLDS